MAKGKHAVSAAKHREAQAIQECERLRGEVAVARERIVALERRIVAEDALRGEVGRLREQATRSTSDTLEQTRAERDDALKKLRLRQEVDVKMDRLVDVLVGKLAACMGVVRADAFDSAIGEVIGEPGAVMTLLKTKSDNVQNPLMGIIERARRLRERRTL